MRIRNIWNSIRWRIVLIYFLLIFIAMTITGVLIMSALESYQMQSTRSNISKIVKENFQFLQSYSNLAENQSKIQQDISAWAGTISEEIFVVDNKLVIIAASKQDHVGQSGTALFDQTALAGALNGRSAEADSVLASGIPIKSMFFPIKHQNNVTGVVCLRADLSDIYQMQEKSKAIFLRAMLIALFITVILGFFIARSITIPINELTAKAERMSTGDFSQAINAKSDDEIGRLAEMFDLLREKLDFTLQEISNEKSKLETIVQHMADGLLAIGMDRRIVLANPAAMRMLMIGQRSIEEKNYDDIIQRFNKKLEFQNILEKSKTGGAEEVLESGNRSYSVRYDRFRDDNNEDIGIILLIRDITEQQKLETMQRDFVANVSHELKTPLTTIKGYTETLLEHEIEDLSTIRNFLNVIDAETDRMNRLVRELLQLSKLDNQQERLTKKESNLITIIHSAVTKMELTASAKSQTLVSDYSTSARLPVLVDRDRIEQVVLNLLSNAIKYSLNDTTIRIETFVEGIDVGFRVIDNGIGISTNEINRVFERFYRVDKARSRDLGGTGLGLPIARQIIEEHSGTIELTSQVGEGTTVTVRLPLSQLGSNPLG